MKLGGIARPQATLLVRHLDANGKEIKNKRGFLGWLGIKRPDVRIAHGCVTDAYVALLVDDLQAAQAGHSTFSYHDSGTGTVAEAATDTALGTPSAEARDTGTQAEGATANIYKSVATHTYGGSFAITEHGLFNAATAGTLMDRTKFAAVNVANGEKIEFTYQLTCSSGG